MSEDIILVVEDAIQMSEFLARELLPHLGYDTLLASDGKSAIWTVKTSPISLILLDLNLPDMSGLDILKQLKAEGYDIPTIMITAEGSEQVAVEALRLGVSDYLPKPIETTELENAITRALTIPRLKREKSALTFKLEEQVSWLRALSEIGKSVTSSLDLDEVLRRIVEAGVDLTGAEEGFLALLDEKSGQLYLRAVKNIDEEKSKTMRLPVSDSLVAEVIRTNKPYRTTQIAEEPPLKVSTGYLVHSLLHAPLISKDKILGVLSVDNHNCKDLFSETHEKQLTSLADYAAVAIENASLYKQAQQEIMERKEAEEKLLHDAFHDSLTGLPNRALFMDRLRYAVERAKHRDDYMFAVLFMDLDRFKDVNDSLGHLAGDQLLIAAAQFLENTLRPTDTVARLGGDEFVILLEDIDDIGNASRTAEKIQDLLKSSNLIEDHELQVSTSIGIVLSATGYNKPEDVLRDADIAMYRAKAQGKARYEIFDPAMRDRIMDRLAIETDLRQALERQDLRVYYQPIISLDTGQLAGLEALIRWQHPTRGLLHPSDFIPIAEETGLVSALDHWVLRKACHQLREWQDQGLAEPELTLSVNLSALHLSELDLRGHVEKILEETGLQPHNLKLEITENAILENNEVTSSVFRQLQAIGVECQIDDFGVGYSSLSYISNFPISAIKIDQSFVSQMIGNGNHTKIIQAIVILAHGLGIEVIAEGVETDDQRKQLRALGCEYGQGYLFSEPVDSEGIKGFIKAGGLEF